MSASRGGQLISQIVKVNQGDLVLLAVLTGWFGMDVARAIVLVIVGNLLLLALTATTVLARAARRKSCSCHGLHAPPFGRRMR